MYLKLLPDQECNVYIDNELASVAPANVLSKIPIEKGEYLIKYECRPFPELYVEEVLFIEFDKVIRISFNSEIQKRKELIVIRELAPQQNRDGLWGFVVKGTTLWGILPTYEKVEGFSGDFDGDDELAIVQKEGSCSIINKKNEVLVRWGRYKEINRYSYLFFGIDIFNNHWVISKEGIPIYKGLKYTDEYRNDKILAMKDFIMVKNDCNEKWKGLFFDGTPIGLLDEFDYAEPKYLLDGWDHPCDFYEIRNGEKTGLALINNTTKTAKWIMPCANEYIINSGYQLDDRHYEDYIEVNEYVSNEYTYEYTFYYYPYKGVLVEYKHYPKHEKERQDDIKIFDNHGCLLFEGTNIDLSYYWGRWALFKREGKEYAVNTEGKVIGPFHFEGGFFQGYAEIIVSGKHGLINENEEIVVPCQFDSTDWNTRYFGYYYYQNYVERKLFVIVEQGKGLSSSNKGIYGIREGRLLVPTEYQQVVIKKDFFCCKEYVQSSNLGQPFESWHIFNLDGDEKGCLSTDEDASFFMAWQDICKGMKKKYALMYNGITQEAYDQNVSRIIEMFL